MSNSELNSRGIRTLPRTLEESIEALQSDQKYLKPYFSNELLETYMDLKQDEVSYVGESKQRQFILYHDV